MSKKKRAPIEQLKEAGKTAKQILQDKGFEAKKSVLDEVMKTPGAPTLPGLPSYLPHQWTIKAAQRILYDLLLMWKDECVEDYEKAENITEFFKFVVTQLRKQEEEFELDIENMPKLLKSLKEVPVLKDVFSPVRKRENVQAIQRFFVDSFAVAIIIKSNHSTSEFANWFLDWTQDLHAIWVKPELREKITRV